MPNVRELSEEQLDIFEEAPLNGNILISGPPGTGKTIIAFLRAQILAKKNLEVTVIMFNRVLNAYTQNMVQEFEGLVKSKTMHSWFPEWWRQHKIPHPDVRLPLVEKNRAYFNCSYEDKENFKQLGGKWDPVKFNGFSQKKGMWYVDSQIYDVDPTVYRQWTDNFNFDPVKIDKWNFNWAEMKELYLDLEKGAPMVNWGHLIIDEGQDFEPDFYSFLYVAGWQLKNAGITILADENQCLEEKNNSSLDDIRNRLKIQDKDDREFHLTKNFRNTKQIAEIARYFYVGLSTGIPELPERNGNVPSIYISTSINGQIDYICNYLRLKGALEVGVIVDNESDRQIFFQYLSKVLEHYHVQTYTSQDYRNSDNLIFDKQGVVTVLNRKSCKGLEFDTVFVPQIQNLKTDDSNETTFKMNMYVVCSRARSELIFMCNAKSLEEVGVLKYLPSESTGLINYRMQK